MWQTIKLKEAKKRVIVFDFDSLYLTFSKMSIESEDRFDVKVLKL